MTEVYQMRDSCPSCGGVDGRIETKNGQDCVYCRDCGRHCYNAPRSETGREVRRLRTRPDIKVSKRAKIIERDGGICVICRADDERVDVGHLLSVDDGLSLGLTHDELNDDENLAAMCAACNSGFGSISINPRLVAALIRVRIQRRETA